MRTPRTRDDELFNLAEKFYLGKINQMQVLSNIDKTEELQRFKLILTNGMAATAKALCDSLDEFALAHA